MNYGAIHVLDTANGPGCRTSLFVSGCTHHCDGCFQPETWDFGYGKEFTKEVEDYIIDTLREKFITGLTILGGEPFEKSNQEALRSLVKRTRDLGKTVWVYTGYTFEELIDPSNKRCHLKGCTYHLLGMINVIVDGEFMKDKKDLRLKFRGSSNQRIIDVPKSIEFRRVCLKEV